MLSKIVQNIIDQKSIDLKKILENLSDYSRLILIFFLILPAALPIPTGGVTHIFEIIIWILSLQIVFNGNALIPKKLIPSTISINNTKWLMRLYNFLVFVEKRMNVGYYGKLNLPKVHQLGALFIFIFNTFAFFAPSFTGLDTLPALGVMLICVGLIYQNIIAFIVALLLGFIGCWINWQLTLIALQKIQEWLR